MSMRRYVPDNSRRASGPGKQPQPQALQPPMENVANSNGGREQSAEVPVKERGSESKSQSETESESESEPESKSVSVSVSHQQQAETGRTRTVFTSEELAAMSREDLVQAMTTLQQHEIKEKTEEELRNRTLVEQPNANSNAPAPVNLSQGERHNAEMALTRNVLRRLGGFKDGNSVRPTVRDANGVVQYWTTNEHKVKVLTPAWEEGFEANMEVWKGEFLSACRVESNMPALAQDYLKTVPDATLLKALRDGAWKTYSANGKKATQGTFEQSRATKNKNNRENGRRNTKAVQRAAASKGTCVDSSLPDFAFLYRPRAQSLSVADRYDANREIVLVPSFISDEALKIKESLDLKIGSKSTKTVEYVKVNEPVPKLGRHTWPGWGISEEWKRNNPLEYKKSISLIDPGRTDIPDITELTRIYNAPRRKYLTSIPPGVQLPEDHAATAPDAPTAPTPPRVFGLPIYPEILEHDQNPVAGPSTLGLKRTVEGRDTVPKRRKKEASVKPRRSSRLQKSEMNEREEIESTHEGAGIPKLVLKISRK
ncbi:hypothetical protein RSAG8_07959, partial [Rhizoctonia solani AG-8 WAC10335]